jgi:hypothetical protein
MISLIRYLLGMRNLNLRNDVLQKWDEVKDMVFTSEEQYFRFYSLARAPEDDFSSIFNIL